ncbi:helix-turn-helix domain-containing protein [Bacteroides uniformis]|jgi:prefoldin subunit 5|uniref:Helix-turn-helix domain-containing protein n=1 Tax=Bacteroides uniformis TaxID=820 RepID=A0A7J5H8V1_BACUN|nr:helix-turn-helix domain-containing protein [Bacteroides uniformis]KAB4186435.1 helix-turn-helix domain-containing protein [Bacteroides uniformis]
MAYKVNSLEEMPNALSYLIESVEALQSKVNALQNKQASNSPKWMDIDDLCAYLPSHPAKQTVYGWVSAKQIPVHKINKALAFLQSEIDDWLKNKSHKTQDELMEEARRFVESKKIIR